MPGEEGLDEGFEVGEGEGDGGGGGIRGEGEEGVDEEEGAFHCSKTITISFCENLYQRDNEGGEGRRTLRFVDVMPARTGFG